MNFRRYAFFAAMFTATIVTVSLPASAQTYKGKFTLESGVQWGPAWLPAGNYTVETRTTPFDRVLFVTAETGSTAIISAVTIDAKEMKGKGQLELTPVNGSYVVTKLSAATAGKEYTFAIPKGRRSEPFGTVALKNAVVMVK